MNSQTKIRIGEWTVSPTLNLLERGERSIKLEPRAMDVLVYLADRAGDVVSVEDLLGSIWKGLVVGDGSVYLAIKQLRQALTFSGDETSYIETIPKRGYRLTVPIERDVGDRIAAATTSVLPPAPESALATPAAGALLTVFSSTRVAWLVAAALALALAAALVPATREVPQAPAETVAILDLEVPGYVAGGLAVSPDGRFIAYTARSDGARQIWLRPLATGTARPLAGTANAANVFWSPDGRSIAFTTDDGTLKRIDVEGGPVRDIAETSLLAWGSGAWSRDDTILHTTQAGTANPAPSGAGASDAQPGFPIGTVSATGGALAPLTVPDLARGETGHFVPKLLPDDEHFVYIGGGPSLPMAAIYLGSRKSATGTALVPTEDLVKVNRRWNLAYADGYLLYPRGTALVAQRLDIAARAVVGEPRAVAENVDDFAVSATGMLVYREGTPSPVMTVSRPRRLAWFDRSGGRVGEIDAHGAFSGPALSPDARHVAVATLAATPGVSDISIIDAERGARLPITVDDAGDGAVVWSRDGARIAFSSGRGSIPFIPSAIYEQSASGTGPQRLLFAGVAGELVAPSDWSPEAILFSRASKAGARQMDIWALPTTGERAAFAVLTSPGRKRGAKLSPDGRWIAYTTDESGRDEVVVQPYPDVDGDKWVISTRGGSSPRWRNDGREIFYVTSDGLLTAVEVGERDAFEIGQSRELFEIVPVDDAPFFDYEVAANGERFLVSEPVAVEAADDASPVDSLRVILNWTALLSDR